LFRILRPFFGDRDHYRQGFVARHVGLVLALSVIESIAR
jgi:hypothetical protein